MKHHSVIRCVLAGILATFTALAGAGTCDVVYNAAAKSVQTPHHLFTTTTRAGKTTTSESLYAGGVEYARVKGVWQRSQLTAEEMLETAKENLASSPDTCTAPVQKTVDGQQVGVFQVQSRETGSRSEVRVLNASGLLQGQSLKLPNGAQVETRYEYGNVAPPPNVQ